MIYCLRCIYWRNRMDNDIKHVHVGQAIDKRRNELGLSKSELGRKIGVPQQHINRILERETMETNRLIKVSEALDFNFFSLFCHVDPGHTLVLFIRFLIKKACFLQSLYRYIYLRCQRLRHLFLQFKLLKSQNKVIPNICSTHKTAPKTTDAVTP